MIHTIDDLVFLFEADYSIGFQVLSYLVTNLIKLRVLVGHQCTTIKTTPVNHLDEKVREIFRALIDMAKSGAKTTFNGLHRTTKINKRILRKHLDRLQEARLVREEGRKEFKEHKNMSLEYSLTPTGEATFSAEALNTIMIDSARIRWLGIQKEAYAQVLETQFREIGLPYEVLYDAKENSIQIEPKRVVRKKKGVEK